MALSDPTGSSIFYDMNMTRKYQIYVEVAEPMGGQRQAFRLELEPEFNEELRTIKTAGPEIPISLRMATEELLEHQAEPRRLDRKNLAKRLAAQIADSLVKAMEANDTHNGYLKNNED